MDFIISPAPLGFAGNLPDVVISDIPDEGVGVVLCDSVTLELLFNEKYYPDAARRATVEILSVMESLRSSVPEGAATLLTPSPSTVGNYILRLSDMTSVNFSVVAGGIEDFDGDMEEFLTRNFLTWDSRPRLCAADSREYLSYIVTEECALLIKASFPDGSDREHAEKILYDSSCKAWTLNVSPRTISAVFGEMPESYTIAVVSGAYTLTPEITYTVAELPDRTQEFVYTNSLGGISTLRFTGKSGKSVKTNSSLFVSARKNIEGRVQFSDVFFQNTGYLRENEIHLVREFLLSPERYHLSGGRLRKIVIEETDNKSERFALNAFEFEFRYETESRYVNLRHPQPDLQPPFPDRIAACFDRLRGNDLTDRHRGHRAAVIGDKITFPALVPDLLDKSSAPFWTSDFAGNSSAREWKLADLNGLVTINYATALCSRQLFFRDITGSDITTAMPVIVYASPLTDSEIEEVLAYLREYYFLDQRADSALLVGNPPEEGANTFLTENQKLK